MVYNIPCGCHKASYTSYTGETWRICNVREKEHQNKVRLTKEDIKNGQITSAEKRTSSEDGGLAKHSTQCTNDIDWAAVRILATATGLHQRKVRESIESLREIHHGKVALNSYKPIEPWRTTLYHFFDIEKDRGNQRQ